MGFLLHHSVIESAQRRPEQTAFRCDGERLTYGDLDRKSDRIAALLLDQGLRPKGRVGLYMSKCLELPVALYGALKAGGAYVPIDPTAPVSRIEFILEDCGIRHLITHPAKARRVGTLAKKRGDCLQCLIGLSREEIDSDTPCRAYSWSDLEVETAAAPAVRMTELDLAYVMYTSGSTGVPKGLMHTHSSGRSYARLSGDLYGVVPEDRLGNHSPLHFDMSTFEYLTGPLFGATTVIIPEEVTMFPVGLAELIERERMTFWYSVPLALIQLVTHGRLEERDCSSLRWVLFGGEPFAPKYLWRLMELWPGARFSNSYGPAEVNQCTYFHVPRALQATRDPIPLGSIWPGAEGLVIGRNDSPVAAGESGELLVRTPTMMRGYWNRADLNARAFFKRETLPGFEETFYRTGDIVRQNDDGQLLFLGRRDRQIKIRGYRVELDEIESVFCSLEAVEEAAAVAIDGSGGELEIFVVAITSDLGSETAEELSRRAADRLPSYCVPRGVEIRSRLPRTGSGKIDRRKLADEIARAP